MTYRTTNDLRNEFPMKCRYKLMGHTFLWDHWWLGYGQPSPQDLFRPKEAGPGVKLLSPGRRTCDLLRPAGCLSVCLSACLSEFVEPKLCITLTVQSYVVLHRPVLCTPDLVVHLSAQGRPNFSGHPWITLIVHVGSQRTYSGGAQESSILVVHSVHTNQGSQCSSVPKYTLV